MRLEAKRGEAGDPAQSSKDSGKSTVLSNQEYQIKASHRFLGIVHPAMLSMGAETDQRSALSCSARLHGKDRTT